VVLLRAPVDTNKPYKASSLMTFLPIIRAVTMPAAPVLALEGATSYWASVVANPPGHTSNFGASSAGLNMVTPGGSARPVSLR